MSSIAAIIDLYILGPFALLAQSGVLITWFTTLYVHYRGKEANTLASMTRTRARTMSSNTTKNKSEISSETSSQTSKHETSNKETKEPTSPQTIDSKTHVHAVQSERNTGRSKRTSSLAALHPIQKWMASISFIFGFIFCLTAVPYEIIRYKFVELSFQKDCLIFHLILIFAVWQRFLLFTYLMVRTYILFKGSFYEIPYRTMKYYLISLLILYIFVTIEFILGTGLCGNGRTDSLLLFLAFINFCIEMFLSIFTLKLVVNKLIKLHNVTANINKEENDKKTQAHLTRLMSVATKIMVLALVAIISTNVNIVFIVVLQWPANGTVVDAVFNTGCLLLSFGAFGKQYRRLCYCCDKCMFDCCRKHKKCVRCCCCTCC